MERLRRTCPEQRRDLVVHVTIRECVCERGRDDGVFGVPAGSVPSGVLRERTEIFRATTALNAVATSVSEPRDPSPIPELESARMAEAPAQRAMVQRFHASSLGRMGRLAEARPLLESIGDAPCRIVLHAWDGDWLRWERLAQQELELYRASGVSQSRAPVNRSSAMTCAWSVIMNTRSPATATTDGAWSGASTRP